MIPQHTLQVHDVLFCVLFLHEEFNIVQLIVILLSLSEMPTTLLYSKIGSD